MCTFIYIAITYATDVRRLYYKNNYITYDTSAYLGGFSSFKEHQKALYIG